MLNLLPPDLPAVQGLKLYQQHFANARELIITLRAPEPEKAERLAGALATRLRQETNLVAGVSWQPPWMEQPAQVAELVACLWLNQPPESFGDLTNRLAPPPRVVLATRRQPSHLLSPMDLARRAFDPYDLLSVRRWPVSAGSPQSRDKSYLPLRMGRSGCFSCKPALTWPVTALVRVG